MISNLAPGDPAPETKKRIFVSEEELEELKTLQRIMNGLEDMVDDLNQKKEAFFERIAEKYKIKLTKKISVDRDTGEVEHYDN